MSKKSTTSEERQQLPTNDCSTNWKGLDTSAADISQKESGRMENRFMRKRSSTSLLPHHASCSSKCAFEPIPSCESPRLETATLGQKLSDRGESTGKLTDFLSDDLFVPEKKARKSSLSPCSSSSSGDSSSSSEESDIVPVKACSVETLPSPRILLHASSSQKLNFFDNGYIGLSDDPTAALHHWDLGNSIFVFAFKIANDYFYIKIPKESGRPLTLTTSGGNPSNITDTTSDERCIEYRWNTNSKGYMLYPAHNQAMAIGMMDNEGKRHLIVTSPKLALKWKLL